MSLRWIASSAEALLDFNWLCCGMEPINDTREMTISEDQLQTVWSGLEYEPNTWDEESASSDSTPMNQADDDDESLEGIKSQDSASVGGRSQRSSQSKERGSNIPVLRQLPSFGSTLGSNSMQSSTDPGSFSYPRTPSMDSGYKQRYFLKPPTLATAEDSVMATTTTGLAKSLALPSTNNESYIFLQQ